jgi:hypothetical protein
MENNQNPHIFKNNYKAQAYILSSPIDVPMIHRLFKVKRLTDNLIIEKGKTVLIDDKRFRIIRFLDFGDDLGIECRSVNDRNLIKEIVCIDCIPETIEI